MTYTSPDGAVVVPDGWGQRSWRAYTASRSQSERGDVIAVGDSTTKGDGGDYSWLQQIRNRAVADGYADGGKGMFGSGEGAGPVGYDSPEVNGFVSSNWAGGFPDAYDNLDGQYYFDDGSAPNRALTLRFRAAGARLWYVMRENAGDFTYSVNGGAPVTVKAYQASGYRSRFVAIDGLPANTTHTVTITNLGESTNGGSGGACYVALAPINATGLAVQKFATSGDTINMRFYRGIGAAPWTAPQSGDRYQSQLGLVPGDRSPGSTPPYTGAVKNATWGEINPVLAIWHLGFNDLTSLWTADLAMWTEYVKIAAGASYDAGCDCVIVSGQLPYNANWPTHGAARFNAMKAQALASGAAFVDLFQPIGGPSLSYAGGISNPHLSEAEYRAQADYLWDNLLTLELPSAWEPVEAERWNGSTWEPVEAERWNGSAWESVALERAR